VPQLWAALRDSIPRPPAQSQKYGYLGDRGRPRIYPSFHGQLQENPQTDAIPS